MPNKFMPNRWTSDMEKSYYAISFNQGPQRCPGKELAIFLVQSFMYNFIRIYDISRPSMLKPIASAPHIDPENVPQIINPCVIGLQMTVS
jgi:cytochrome P450